MSATTQQAQVPDFNLLDPAFIANPYPIYHRLRAMAPVWRSPIGFNVVTRYDTAALVLRDRRFGKNYVENITKNYGPQIVDEPAYASMSRTMLVLDPPDHTRLRSLVTKAFTARRVEAMRPQITAVVDALLDRVQPQGGMDVIKDFAHRLPIIVICDMLGIPEADREQFFTSSRVNGRLVDPVPLSPDEIAAANAILAVQLLLDCLLVLEHAAVGVKQALRALEILLAQLVQLRLQAVQLILPPLLHVKEADTKEHEENHLPAEDDEEPIRLATARRNFLTPAGCEGASLGMRRVHRRMRRPRTSAHAGHGAAPDGEVHESRVGRLAPRVTGKKTHPGGTSV